MLDLAILSSKTELCCKLESLCSSFLPKTATIKIFSSFQDIASFLDDHEPFLLFVANDFQHVDAIHLISELHLHHRLVRYVLILDREKDYRDALQRSMREGISNILFYPFSQEEVYHQLLRAMEQAASPDDAQAELALSIRSLRDTFIDRFLESDDLPYSVSALNAQYHVNLSNGMFRVLLIRFPNLTEQDGVGHCQMMQGCIVTDVRRLLDPVCFEMIPFIRDMNTLVFVLNYSSARNVDQQLRMIPELLQRNIAQFFRFPILYVAGVGHAERGSFTLRQAFQSAQYAARCQLLFGPNQLFLYDDYAFDHPDLDGDESKAALDALAVHAEALDAKGAVYAIYQYTSVMTRNMDPALISTLCERIRTTTLTAMRKAGELPENAPSPEEVDYHLNTETSLSGLKSALADWVQRMIERCLESRSQALPRPIHEARQYIEQNYARQLSLQTVAEKIGLSASYFCTIFRKEVGTSFSAYLSGVRVEHAKRMLRETRLDVSTIAERVGYRDARYFSRVFFKATGMQPTAYRDLYQRGA